VRRCGNEAAGSSGAEHAELLIRLARETIGVKEGVAGIAMDIRHILVQLEATDRFVAEIESEMKVTLAHIPFSARILSMKGLGTVTVAGLIGEVGDFTKFRTQSEIMKLAGLDLYEISSGKRKGQRRISKRGRSLLRKILYYAAISTIRKNGIMCGHYGRLIGRGMKRTSALVVIAKKLLRIIDAIVRDDRDYERDYGSPKRMVIQKAA
jgi:transposase